jgi:hypothetical protein
LLWLLCLCINLNLTHVDIWLNIILSMSGVLVSGCN